MRNFVYFVLALLMVAFLCAVDSLIFPQAFEVSTAFIGAAALSLIGGAAKSIFSGDAKQRRQERREAVKTAAAEKKLANLEKRESQKLLEAQQAKSQAAIIKAEEERATGKSGIMDLVKKYWWIPVAAVGAYLAYTLFIKKKGVARRRRR